LAFEPIVVAEDFYVEAALQLNRDAEGMGLVQPTASPAASIVVCEPVARSENLEMALFDELCRVVEAGLVDQRPSTQAGIPCGEYRASAVSARDSTNDADHAEPLAQEAAESRWTDGSQLDEGKPVVLGAERGGNFFDWVASELAGRDEGEAPTTSTDPASLPTFAAETVQTNGAAAGGIPWPAFAPVDPSTPASTEMAHQATVPWPVFAPGDSTAEAQAEIFAGSAPTAPQASWGQAVQLTRQAVFAWMKVLAGPALVEVSAR
jgi:hypothetical protein